MQNPKVVLEYLSKYKSAVNNIYKNLYNPEFYKLAYENIGRSSNIDKLTDKKIERIIESLRKKTYSPFNPLNKKIRLKDRLIQEVIRMLLESIYDHHFSDNNHGFRPNRNCHTALKYIQNHFQAPKWWISINLEETLIKNIDHNVLLDILRKKIKEQKFIALINLFIKNGYLEKLTTGETYSGTPCRTIIAPILINIYLNELDDYICGLIKSYDRGNKRADDSEYKRIQSLMQYYDQKVKNGKNVEDSIRERDRLKKERDEYRRKHGSKDPRDSNYRRLKYVRYSGSLLFGVSGPKLETEEIKEKIKTFLSETLKLTIDDKKFQIIHNSSLVSFLGYDLSVAKSDKKTVNGLVHLWLPHEVCKNFIIQNRFGKFVCDKQNGKPRFKATHRTEMINIDEYEILMQYSEKLRGLYNYYKMASNVCKLSNFAFIVQLSFMKTLATKYKTTCAKLYRNKNYNHSLNGAHLGITYDGKFYELFNGPFNVVKRVKYEKDIDDVKNLNSYFGRTSTIQRMEAKVCSVCGNTDGPFEIHHVKSLRNMKHKPRWIQLLSARSRKTVVLCLKCHDELHAD